MKGLVQVSDDVNGETKRQLLVGKRSAAESHARSASVTKCIYYKQSAGKEVRDSLRKAEANGYYRDRGRQPMKTPIPTIHT